ncbi:rCG57134 [Rattus norvegicus]|uniref:RCG57134 n=1 Tax=Rattus norvegicus TaxID=10116 RepID=A6JD11_RAT|nr:rCG57134 [Rattus norvegicus]
MSEPVCLLGGTLWEKKC